MPTQQATMRNFDESILPKIKKLTGLQIKSLRNKEKVSLAGFARHLNVSEITVKRWELELTSPNGTTQKALNLIMHKGLKAIMW